MMTTMSVSKPDQVPGRKMGGTSARLFGWSFRLAGGGIVDVGVFCYVLVSVGGVKNNHAFLAFLLLIPFYAVFRTGRWLGRAGRRLLAPAGASAYDRKKNFVLFLRSFSRDEENASVPDSGAPYFELFKSAGHTTEEELVAAVRTIGRMEAIGSPQDSLSFAGGRRHYAVQDWQGKVASMLGRARLVLLEIDSRMIDEDALYRLEMGKTDGVIWELFQAAKMKEPKRLVLLVSLGEDDYRRFREFYGERFEQGLPVYLQGNKTRKDMPVKAAVYFEDDWTPRMVRFDDGWRLARTESAFVYQLKPIYKKLGASWPGVSAWLPVRYALTRGNIRSMAIPAILVLAAAILAYHSLPPCSAPGGTPAVECDLADRHRCPCPSASRHQYRSRRSRKESTEVVVLRVHAKARPLGNERAGIGDLRVLERTTRVHPATLATVAVSRSAHKYAGRQRPLFGRSACPNQCVGTWRLSLSSARRGPDGAENSTPGCLSWTRSHPPPAPVFPRARHGRSLNLEGS
jgi:hypothetical protein